MALLRNLLPRGRPPAVPPLPGALPQGMRIGPWRVVRPLGGGGSGAVYLVRRWGRDYALKLAMRPGDKRLLREGRLLRRMKHPGVVKLRGSGWWLGRKKGFPYLVMEYVEGLSLYAWARGTNPTARQLAELLAQAADALEALHAERSTHRDLKGANTLVRPGGRQLVLLDLGAGDYPGATPLTTQVLPPATELYLSPEAMDFAQAHATDTQARYKARPTDDLYALGVMAHRVLADDYPFPVHMPRDLFWLAVRSRPAPNAHEQNPRVPEVLAAIVQRLLAKQPEQRYASAREVARVLRKAAEEGGPEWDAPLFEWYTGPEPASRTTQGVAPAGPVAPGQEAALRMARAHHHEWQEWMRERRMVRRRPPAAAQGGQAAPVPEPVAAPAPQPLRPWRRVMGVLALMLALALGAAGLTLLDGAGPPRPREATVPTLDDARALPTQGVGDPGQEVAPALLTPDAGNGAAPSDSEASTPAPVAPATPPQEDSRVNPPASPTTARHQKEPPLKPKRTHAPGSALAKVLPLCLGMACAHNPQELHPVPLSEECPPGAVQTMGELGLKEGDLIRVTFLPLGEQTRDVTVKEGWATLRLPGNNGSLPHGTHVSGRIFFGEHIYGRFTIARMPDERTVPVCMELWNDINNTIGWERSSDSTPANVLVVSDGRLRVVNVFK